ncbi:MAG: DNA polymerase IV [Clostridia bacterium]|nr:DNA polymerase IV [Clostridia bacterium]
MQKILHIDMNKFYATVEQMLDPSLRGKAIAVCGSTEERHGIVLTASAEAKAMGVRTGMANWEARRECPGLIMVPPQYDQYCKYSKLARGIYARYANDIEPFGMDECWVDISPICRDFNEAEETAHEIRRAVKAELGLTVSIGVSFSKVLAKLGSDMKKPDAVTLLAPENWKERVFPLPVSDLLYCGPATTRKLNARAVFTIGDLAESPVEWVRMVLGKNGVALWQSANGLDRAPVQPADYRREVKSVSHGITCSRDLMTEERVWKVLLELSQEVGHQLRGHGLAARGVRIYIRESDIGYGLMKQTRVQYPTQSPAEIAQAARSLFIENYAWRNPVRAVCVATFDLVPENTALQTTLFDDGTKHVRQRLLDDCVDGIRGRFGKHAIVPAQLLGDLYMPDDGRHSVKMPGLMHR